MSLKRRAATRDFRLLSRPGAWALWHSMKARVRRLPFVREPVAGESFPSWLDRTSAALGAPAGVVAEAIGLPVRRHHTDSVPSMLGIVMAASTESAASIATGLDPTTLRDMHLTRYHGGALNLSELDPVDERSLAGIARREWVSLHGSRACPRCLADSGGAWQIHWKLSLAAVCVAHGVVLVDQCPRCAVPLRRTRQGRPSALSRLQAPDPTACHAGRHRCGADITAAASATASTRLIAAQRRLHNAAHGGEAVWAGRPIPAAEYFARIRALGAAARFAADAALLPPGTPTTVAQAFSAHVDLDRGRGGGNVGYRTRPATAAASAALLAVLAESILAGSAQEFDQAVEPLARAVRRARTERGHNPLRGLPLPAALRAQPAPFVGRVAAAAGPQGDRGNGPPPQWIPTVVDDDAYRRVTEFLPGTLDLTGRRFTALAAARVAGARSWAEAARWTGWPVEAGCHTAEVVTQRVTHVEEFWEAVRVITDQLAVGGVDWQQRRERLQGLTVIDPRQLGEARADAAPWTGSRRRCAAAWAWATCTSSDWRVSPAMRDPRWAATTASRRELYRRFSRRISPRLADALVEYATQIGGAR